MSFSPGAQKFLAIFSTLCSLYLLSEWAPHCLCSAFHLYPKKNGSHHQSLLETLAPHSRSLFLPPYHSAVELSRNSKHDSLFSSSLERVRHHVGHPNFSNSSGDEDSDPLWMEQTQTQEDATGGKDLFKFYSSPPVYDTVEFTHYNVGVLLVSGTGSSFDLEKCSPAVDMALDYVNEVYLKHHRVVIHKVQNRFVMDFELFSSLLLKLSVN